MTDTPNKGFHEPLNGSTGWDLPLNQNFTLIDTALGASTAIAVNTVVSPTPVPLLLAQYQCMTFLFAGALSVDATYEVPAGVAGQWVCINNSTGVHTITISQNLGGPTVVIPQGTIKSVYTDGSSNGVVVVDTQFATSGNQYQIGVFGADHVLAGSDAITFDGVTLTAISDSATTNTVKTALAIRGTSSAAPAVGIGVGEDFVIETASSVYKTAMQVQAVSTDVTTSSEDADLLIRLLASGSVADILRLTSLGAMTLMGNAVLTAGQAAAQSITNAGITATATNDGSKSSGTYTPSPDGGNFKGIINQGNFVLSSPSHSGDYTLLIQISNGASAGVITLTGFNKTSGSFDVIVGHNFFLYITKCNSLTYANVVPLQ